MKFKDYPRRYERVFTGEVMLKKKCDIEKVHVLEDYYILDTYIQKLKETTREFDLKIFDFLVKYEWLVGKFCYKEFSKIKDKNYYLDQAFGTFMRFFIGFDNRVIFRTESWFRNVVSYFEDFFPEFRLGDPFKEKFEYPFQYMSLNCLYLVNEMNERMELLKHCEEKKMNYSEFTDYVINYISCYNEEYKEEDGIDYYILVFSERVQPYIKRKKLKKYGTK